MTFIHSQPMTAFMADVTSDQRRWLETLLAERNMTATELACKAQLNPSTLTRFLQGNRHGHTLSPRTVRKIEDATTQRRSTSGLVTEEAIPFHAEAAPLSPLRAALLALKEGRNGMDAWTITTNELEGIRLFEGDVVMVDLNADPVAGDIVCAHLNDWPHGKVRTVFRLYEPPYLLAGGVGPGRRPEAVDGRNVRIRGVVAARISARSMLHLAS